MIKLSTVLRGLSNEINSYALAQPVDLVHFQALAVIFHNKAAEVEAQEGWTGTPGLQIDLGVLHFADQIAARLVKAADEEGHLTVGAAVKVLADAAYELTLDKVK